MAWTGNMLQAQTALCAGDSLTLNLSGQSGAIQWQSSTDGGTTWASIPGANSASYVDYPTTETWYRAIVTTGTCNPFFSDTTHVLRSNLVVDAGIDRQICTGSPVPIGGSPTASGGVAPYTYLWTNGATLSSTTVANPSATISAMETYILTVTDAIGCSGTDTLTLLPGGVASSGADTLTYTGALQTFTVPPCVDSVWIECWGAQGGAVTAQSPFPQGGLGARMRGKFAVTPGQVLNVVVGGRGNSDPSSSGGGGASGVADGSTPWIIAGGGGGHDFQDPGYAGVHAVVTPDGVNGNGGQPGLGGIAGADGGDHAYTPNEISRGGRGWLAGNAGSTGLSGLSSSTTFTAGTWGLGGGGGSVGYGWCNCGGGGGGYSGGGSADINQSGGGGGSYNVGVQQNNSGGVWTGAGQVIITW
jgi:hypothetical protein